MPAFSQGQRVTVIHGHPKGLGTVHDVYGGPQDALYRVLMDQPGDDGMRTMAQADERALVPAPAIEPYSVGQRVTYLGRGARVTDVAPNGTPEMPGVPMVYVLCDRDPPELFNGVEHEYIFIMPAWKLHAYAR